MDWGLRNSLEDNTSGAYRQAANGLQSLVLGLKTTSPHNSFI
jgi:hypothetical protein